MRMSGHIKVVAAVLILSVVMYLSVYNFRSFGDTSISGNDVMRHFLSKSIQTMGNELIQTSDKETYKTRLDMGDIGKVIGNLSDKIQDIQKKLKALEDNNTGNVNISETSTVKDTSMPETLLTLFSTWTMSEENAIIYRNTLKNWASFKPIVNPVLFTNDSVSTREAEAAGWTTFPISQTAENGLPVLKFMFKTAVKVTHSVFYCYANSDILFDGGLIKTLVNLVYMVGKGLHARPLFITGLRWNVINVAENETLPRSNLKLLIKERGEPFSTSAEDYFITNRMYPWQEIPEVVVGAIAYDNWLVMNAREKKHLVINTSRTIPALHQSLDDNNHRSHARDTVNYNAEMLKTLYKINLPYHKGFLDCIEKYTDFVNDTFVLGDRMLFTHDKIKTFDMKKEYKGIRVETDNDRIAVVTMCNDDNKFTMDYVTTWHKVLDDIEKNQEVEGLITTGEGKAFSTGLDTKWLQTQSPATLDEYHDELHILYKRIISLGLTTVAIVNGHAIAEGAFIALMHDYRIMRRDRGWINWPEVHLKLPFTRTMLDLFRVKVPNGFAQREALVFGKRLDAETAKLLGIVDVTVEEEDLMTEAKKTLKAAIGKLSLNKAFSMT